MQVTDIPFRLAFLDDRIEQRETVVRGIRDKLPAEWECLECPLLRDPSAYPEWILRNNVLVLLVDQLLNEHATDSEAPVNYKGHDVVHAVRQRLVDFPVYIITKATEDPDLQGTFGEAEGIVGRVELLRDAEQFVARFSRQGRQYVKQFEDELAELSELSQRLAIGNTTTSEIQRLHALQAKLGMPAIETPSADEALNIFANEIDKLDSVRRRIERFLDEHRRKGSSGRTPKKKKRKKRKDKDK